MSDEDTGYSQDFDKGIYKYVYDDEIIYIGRSGYSILNRISSHTGEEQFKPYLDKAEIFYFPCKDEWARCLYEIILINKYRPILNSALMTNEPIYADVQEPQWESVQKIKDTRREYNEARKRIREREKDKKPSCKMRDRDWAILNSCVMGHRAGFWNIPKLDELQGAERDAWINTHNTSSHVWKVNDWKNAGRSSRQANLLPRELLEEKLRELMEG